MPSLPALPSYFLSAVLWLTNLQVKFPRALGEAVRGLWEMTDAKYLYPVVSKFRDMFLTISSYYSSY